MTYLVTGATGGFGGYALKVLKDLVPISETYVLARSEEKGQALKDAGYNVRIGSYSDEASMKKALTGIDRLLFISMGTDDRQANQKNVIDAAKEAGVSYIAYTSFPDADNSKSGLSADHRFTEKLIKESGIAHTFLRNNWYLENEMPIIGGAMASGKFVYAAGEGKTGWALKREYAEVAAKALAGADFSEVLELSRKPVTYAVLADALEQATGKKFDIIAGNDKEFIDSLINAGLPEQVAKIFLVFQYDIKDGQLDVDSTDFEMALGHELMSFPEAIKELLK
ncbi:SDR family oxidoreductase [Dellaglioa sp. L3N]